METFRGLAMMQRLDWRGMRASVQAAVARDGSLTLGNLLAEHPPTAGVVEVLGYLQIARDDGHIISRDANEEILVPPRNRNGRAVLVTVPLIQFIPKTGEN